MSPTPRPRRPERDLERLCLRYGVPYAEGERLLPLVRRANAASGGLRRNLLDVVEAALARAAEQRRKVELDERTLLALAETLHRWGQPG